MKYRNCLVCDSSNLKFSHQIKNLENTYIYEKCLDCKFTFQNPWPTPNILQIYNDKKYWNSTNVYNSNENVNNKSGNSYGAYQSNRTKEAKKRYDSLKKYFNSPGRVLEIACANGIFLKDWKNDGWECLGVDPAEEMIELGKHKFSLDLKCNKWEDLDIDDKKFNCIFMWGADSNFYEFDKGFNKIYASLEKNGIFAMSYQDFDHPIRKIFKQIKMQYHCLYLFSKKSIHLYLKNLGFEILEDSLSWQYTRFSHIKKVLGIDTKGLDFELLIPAISYNIIICRKI